MVLLRDASHNVLVHNLFSTAASSGPRILVAGRELRQHAAAQHVPAPLGSRRADRPDDRRRLTAAGGDPDDPRPPPPFTVLATDNGPRALIISAPRCRLHMVYGE